MTTLLGMTLTLLAAPASAQACSVCFGDPNSPLVKGAVMGVAVLVGVVSSVLFAIAGTGVFWIVRSRRLAGHSSNEPPREPE